MITVAIFNSIVVFYAYLARHKRTEFWLKVSFVLILLFLAFRYDYGNDYYGYLKKFQEINQVRSIDLFDKDFRFEPGWIFLCRLFKPLGFFAMTAILALFNCFIYYRFIKKNVQPDYYWLAVFIYVFNPYFMLLHSSAMRQSVAISLFLYSTDYINKKKPICYFLCISLASVFHSSALVLLPIYLLCLFNFKMYKFTTVILFILYVVFFVYGKSILPYINLYINNYSPQYKIYESGGNIETGFGLIFSSVFLVIILNFAKYQKNLNSILFNLVILSYLLLPLSVLLIMFDRIRMYFDPITIAVFPVILSNMQNNICKKIFMSTILLFTLFVLYYGFFNSNVYGKTFGTYQSVFSSPVIY